MNLQRRHRLGSAVLNLYANLGAWQNDSHGRYRHLQPYFERMQRAYRKSLKTRRKAKEEAPEAPKE